MTQTEKDDAVIADLLRGLGLEASPDVLRWIRNPGAVRKLLTVWADSSRNTDELTCGECDASVHFEPHGSECPVVGAWRALGMQYAEDDYERAWTRALAEDVRRARPNHTHPGTFPEVVVSPHMRDAEAYLISPQDFEGMGLANGLTGPPFTVRRCAHRTCGNTPVVGNFCATHAVTP